MKKSSFWLQFGILCLGFVALNGFAKRFVKGSVPHVILHDIRSHPNPTHIFVGNSVMAIGAHPEVVKTALPDSRPLNIAIGGSKPADYFLSFNQLKTSATDKPKVFVGFFDRELTDADQSDWSDLMSNRSICYLTDIHQATRLLAAGKPVLNLQMRLTNYMPLLVERGTIWNKVEQMKRKMGASGMPKERTNEFGRVGDFAALEEKDLKEFADECGAAVSADASLNPSITSIVKQTKERGGQLVFIEMPMTALHRHNYYSSPQWNAYHNHIKDLVAKAGAQYIDASEWMPDSSFSDRLHMTRPAGMAFTAKLRPYMK